MLRTGILFLLSSSAGVMARFNEVPFFTGPEARILCLAGLVASLFLFVLTFARTVFPRRIHVHWTAWVPAFTHR